MYVKCKSIGSINEFPKVRKILSKDAKAENVWEFESLKKDGR